MSRLIRRAMSTIPPIAGASKAAPIAAASSLPPPAKEPKEPKPKPEPRQFNTLFASASSVASTLPLAVRRRREKFPGPARYSLSPLSDPAYHVSDTKLKFPPSYELEFRALIRDARFERVTGEKELRALYLKAAQEWKARVRGYAARGKKGKFDFLLSVMGGKWAKGMEHVGNSNRAPGVDTATGPMGASGRRQRLVGQRIYLPNVQIRLMRNHTPPGQAYDPMIATFRIPPSMTKTDLRSYLQAVYDLPVTFIRTDNYIGQIKRYTNGRVGRQTGSTHNYKRAVVGLTEPFHYPDDLEEMYAQGELRGTGTKEADNRLKFLEDTFQIEAMDAARKRVLFKVFKGYRWRARSHNNAAHTIKAIMAKREAKEQMAYGRISDVRHEAMEMLVRDAMSPEERAQSDAEKARVKKAQAEKAEGLLSA